MSLRSAQSPRPTFFLPREICHPSTLQDTRYRSSSSSPHQLVVFHSPHLNFLRTAHVVDTYSRSAENVTAYNLFPTSISIGGSRCSCLTISIYMCSVLESLRTGHCRRSSHQRQKVTGQWRDMVRIPFSLYIIHVALP